MNVKISFLIEMTCISYFKIFTNFKTVVNKVAKVTLRHKPVKGEKKELDGTVLVEKGKRNG